MATYLRYSVLVILVGSTRFISSECLAQPAQAKTNEADSKAGPNKHVFEGDVIEGGVMGFDGDVINGSYMDFKGDVIEGTRKAPGALVELGSKNPTLESLILKRPDFNDYHDQEKTRSRLKPQAKGQRQ